MATASSKRPNVLFVVMDCVRADHCSAYGYHRPTTPTLEQLASDGVIYERAISPAGWSLPSHASLFTGLFPSRHGADDQHQFLNADVPTLAEILANDGYRTLGFCGNPWVSNATGLTRGFQVYDALASAASRNTSPMQRAARRLVRKAILVASAGRIRRADWASIRTRRWIERLANEPQPFFMFVHYNEPHTPHQLPMKDRMRFARDIATEDEVRGVNQDVNAIVAGATHWTERDYEIYSRIYDAGIAYSDERLGQIIDCLRRTGQLDNTMIIVTADHGEGLGEHGLLGHKVNLYDTLIQVPLIIRYPQGERAGTRESAQVQTLDVVPTILDVTKANYPTSSFSLQGRNLLGDEVQRPFTISEQAVPRFDMFMDKFPLFDPTPFARKLEAIRTDEWKYIWASDDRHELYDLIHDPGERENRIHDRPDIARELQARLFDWLEPMATTAAAGQANFDDTLTERLRDLGYIP